MFQPLNSPKIDLDDFGPPIGVFGWNFETNRALGLLSAEIHALSVLVVHGGHAGRHVPVTWVLDMWALEVLEDP